MCLSPVTEIRSISEREKISQYLFYQQGFSLSLSLSLSLLFFSSYISFFFFFSKRFAPMLALRRKTGTEESK